MTLSTTYGATMVRPLSIEELFQGREGISMSTIRLIFKFVLVCASIAMFFNGCASNQTTRFLASVQDDDRDHYLPGTLRYAIWNFSRPEVQDKDSKKVAGYLMTELDRKAKKYAELARTETDPAKVAVYKTVVGMAPVLKQKMQEPVAPGGPTLLQATIGGMKKIYGGIAQAMIPAENAKIAYINANVIPKMNEARSAAGKPAIPAVPALTGVESYTPAQQRFRALLLVARGQANQFFKELRQFEPSFFIPGDGPTSGHPLFRERPTHLITRDKDVTEGQGADSIPPGEGVVVPPYTTVIYTNPMEIVTHGEYMLSGEGRAANKEKPGMHKVVNRRFDNNQFSTEAGQRQVRATVRRLTINAIKDSVSNKKGAGTIDIAKYVSRHVPMGMVSEYFGFLPPDFYTQVQWSRNTQNAFFHDPLDLRAFDGDAIASGKEMNSYIRDSLLPNLEQQIANGRPAYDTMGLMMAGHSGIDLEQNMKERIVTNVMGLLVGAGETTTTAINRALYILLKPENKQHLAKAVRLAKELRWNNDPKDNEPLDQIVWEALRFHPINPWVERDATRDYEFTSFTEGTNIPQKVQVPVKGRVLLSSQSAMFDTARFSSPFEFQDNRDLDKYIHMSINYHRCLGDDVALAMVPEAIKAILNNLIGLSNPSQAMPTQPAGVPFPESFVLNYDSVARSVNGPANWLGSARNLLFGLEQQYGAQMSDQIKSDIKSVKAYVAKTDNMKRVLGKVDSKINRVVEKPVRVDLKAFADNEQAVERIYEAMVSTESMRSRAVCDRLRVDSYNERQVELCGSKIAKKREYAICYFLQRTAALRTPQHAFNYCAYGKDLLSDKDVATLRGIYNGKPGGSNFYFLKFL